MSEKRSVRISNKAEKSPNKIDSRFKPRILEAIVELSKNPLLGKKLKAEFEGLRSFRIGSYRIVYRFKQEYLDIVYIDHRKDVYR